MKKVIILAMLLVFGAASFGQEITPRQDWRETDYYKKSQKQKTAAWIMLGGGAVLFIGGAVYDADYRASHPNQLLGGINAGTIIGTVGLFPAIGSIPLFIASSRNMRKAKATSVFIDMEKAQVVRGTVFNSQSFPVIEVRISLK